MSAGMDVVTLGRAMAKLSDSKKACLPGQGGKKCKKEKWRVVFPMLYPSKMGTPRTFAPGSANDSLGPQSGSPSSPPPSAQPSEGVRPSKAKVLHEMKRSLGLVEFFDNHSWSSSPNPAWGGYSVPNFGMINMRGGGPVIGGPGFQHDPEFKGGRYDMRKSPGLGFRTEAAWRVWEKVLEIIEKYKTMPRNSVLLRAMARAGLHYGQIDPSEMRLLEMGIEWYLTNPGASPSQRDLASPTGGTLAGPGAP